MVIDKDDIEDSAVLARIVFGLYLPSSSVSLAVQGVQNTAPWSPSHTQKVHANVCVGKANI